MPASVKTVVGYEAVMKELQSATEPTYVLFCGSKDESGGSWCPDCVKAEPVVEEFVKNLPQSATFIHCEVGPRNDWKDMTNSFRTDEKLKLTAVPTLIKWKTRQRLVEEQCSDRNLVQMLFED